MNIEGKHLFLKFKITGITFVTASTVWTSAGIEWYMATFLENFSTFSFCV